MHSNLGPIEKHKNEIEKRISQLEDKLKEVDFMRLRRKEIGVVTKNIGSWLRIRIRFMLLRTITSLRQLKWEEKLNRKLSLPDCSKKLPARLLIFNRYQKLGRLEIWENWGIQP